MKDENGMNTIDECGMCGSPCKCDVTHPECVLFEDETCDNLDNNDDHSIGGENFVKGIEKDYADTR